MRRYHISTQREGRKGKVEIIGISVAVIRTDNPALIANISFARKRVVIS